MKLILLALVSTVALAFDVHAKVSELVTAVESESDYRYTHAEGSRLVKHSFNSFCGDLLELWSSSYAKEPELRNFIFVSDFEDKRQKTFGYVGYDPKERDVVVVFRGSENLQNWFNNLDTVKTDWERSRGRVHKGFLRGYSESLQEQLWHLVETTARRFKARAVTFTGHSLGGALAQLSAVDIGQDLPDSMMTRVITFGSPRVGDPIFRNQDIPGVVDSIFRVVHRRDSVPGLPLRSFGFRHGAQEVWYHNKRDPSEYRLCRDSDDEDKNCSRGGIQTSLDQHLMYLGIQAGQCTGDIQSAVADATT
ncbi:MAG: hypothetical protein MHM6MM_003681 [Cercozoa sp. M6MM]